jgi:hypothetical protein
VTSHDWTVLGLAIDMVGALLLSVEAIKLENLRTLRNNLFERMRKDIRADISPVPFIGAFVLIVGGGLLLLGNYRPKKIIDLPAWAEPLALVVVAVVVVPVTAIVLVALIFAVSLAISATLTIGLTGGIWVLDYIDRKTPDGTIGIIGATLLVLGFAFQLAGA